jgi:adenine specific DNA methylase Mod
MIALDENFLNLNSILVIIFYLTIWILSFISLIAYFVVRIILSVTKPKFGGPPLPEEGLPEGWNMAKWRMHGENWLEKQDKDK